MTTKSSTAKKVSTWKNTQKREQNNIFNVRGTTLCATSKHQRSIASACHLCHSLKSAREECHTPWTWGASQATERAGNVSRRLICVTVTRTHPFGYLAPQQSIKGSHPGCCSGQWEFRDGETNVLNLESLCKTTHHIITKKAFQVHTDKMVDNSRENLHLDSFKPARFEQRAEYLFSDHTNMNNGHNRNNTYICIRGWTG